MTTNFLCQVEGYDLPPMLGSQIRIVALTTMQRSWFLVLSFEMKKKLHRVSYIVPSFFQWSNSYAESLTTTMLTATLLNWSLLTPKSQRIPTYVNILDCGSSWCCFYKFCGFWHFQLRSLRSFFLNFNPRVQFAKRAWPHKCAYASEGLWCRIHKLFQQQRSSTIFYC
jgi:hypothetical protein